MSYGPSAGRSSPGRPRGFDKPKKAKTRKSSTHHSAASYREESGARPLKEVVDRTLAGLDNLGSQTFATPPFQQHFDRWLKSLMTVLDDFEASPLVKGDDVFHEERGGILSAVEAALKAEQAKEASRGTTILGLHGSKDLLLQVERGQDAKLREHSARRDQALRSLNDAVGPLRAELDEVLESRAGLLEGITKSRAKREQEARTRLADAEKGIEVAKARFAEELTALRGEYERKRQEILEKVAAERREIEKLEVEAEIDGSIEVRRVACEELAEAVKALVRRAEEKKIESG
ncbi:MAG: hypothetical protein NTV61_07260 [Candidatus Bathyarchaeota archaeon]|nr:hypothetical protein [Candidatus Bathyarchaeota archaeon]